MTLGGMRNLLVEFLCLRRWLEPVTALIHIALGRPRAHHTAMPLDKDRLIIGSGQIAVTLMTGPREESVGTLYSRTCSHENGARMHVVPADTAHLTARLWCMLDVHDATSRPLLLLLQERQLDARQVGQV